VGLDKELINEQQAAVIAIRVHKRSIAFVQRWLTHYENRIAYERAMLAEGGGNHCRQDRPGEGQRLPLLGFAVPKAGRTSRKSIRFP